MIKSNEIMINYSQCENAKKNSEFILDYNEIIIDYNEMLYLYTLSTFFRAPYSLRN